MEGCHCYTRFITTSIAVSLAFLMLGSQVDATATLELLMVRFDNPSSRDQGGGYCDHILGIHRSQCDHIFRFALDRGNSNNNPRGSYYWTRTTGHFTDRNEIVFGHDMAGVENPIVTSFNTWPSIGVKFKVLVTDHDRLSGNDLVDGFVQLLQPTPAANLSVASWTTVNMVGTRNNHRTSFVMKHKLYCDANYYSSDCSLYCAANDTDAGGHYTCDPITGNKICRPGWEDEATNCRTLSNDCLDHACENGATCVDGVRSYTCRCLPGYTGKLCSRSVFQATNVNMNSAVTPRSGVHRSTDAVTNSTATPRPGAVIISNNTVVSSHPWFYVLICAICLILMGILILIAFLWIRRRKTASISENRSQTETVPQSSSATSSPAPLSPQPPSYSAAAADTAAAAAIFSVANDSVDMQAAYGRKFSQEKLIPFNGRQNSRARKDEHSYDNHVYDTVGTSQ